MCIREETSRPRQFPIQTGHRIAHQVWPLPWRFPLGDEDRSARRGVQFGWWLSPRRRLPALVRSQIAGRNDPASGRRRTPAPPRVVPAASIPRDCVTVRSGHQSGMDGQPCSCMVEPFSAADRVRFRQRIDRARPPYRECSGSKGPHRPRWSMFLRRLIERACVRHALRSEGRTPGCTAARTALLPATGRCPAPATAPGRTAHGRCSHRPDRADWWRNPDIASRC